MKWLLAGLSFVTAAVAAESYHFASIKLLAEQEVGRIVLPQLYAKLDIQITITPLPGKRAEHNVVNGQLDGEIMRIYSYGDENPNMVRVPTAYYFLETMPFVSASRNLRIEDQEHLQQFIIGKVRGVKHTNNMTAGMPRVHDFDTTEEMMRLVEQGLIDVALTSQLNGVVTLTAMDSNRLIATTPPLDKQDLYHYIHQRHKTLVPRIDKVIAQSIANGELAKLISEAEKQVFERAKAKKAR
ncbi:transporter substrate-binding domain-containing protein [Aliiglaciecola sp. CAU 1673]|uniref:substrate-binding periplasmic protein n=1 Tax=Aliiglaciecola sp. CAU 1673 TaxID=3032595 RepID=UPI0023DC16CD|nr:transporter substrate-binding domain-containing protein [Aliiglaciecola sp. CAU 1673]MDF2178495.1 transporter substrate-binding domain-containing protein [Aliiglaciecola sp. CAU 1673]